MAGTSTKEKGTRQKRKATTLEGRENQMIMLAMDEVEYRIRNHTATSSELVHFMKLGSTKAKREERLEEEQIKLMQAKTEQIESQKVSEELYKEALASFRVYSGQVEEVYDDEEDVF